MFAPKPVGGFGANPAAAAGDFGDAGGGFNAIPAAAAGGFGAAAAAAGGFGAAGGGLFAKPAAAAGGFGAMPAAAGGGFGAAAGGFGGLGGAGTSRGAAGPGFGSRLARAGPRRHTRTHKLLWGEGEGASTEERGVHPPHRSPFCTVNAHTHARSWVFQAAAAASEEQERERVSGPSRPEQVRDDSTHQIAKGLPFAFFAFSGGDRREARRAHAYRGRGGQGVEEVEEGRGAEENGLCRGECSSCDLALPLQDSAAAACNNQAASGPQAVRQSLRVFTPRSPTAALGLRGRGPCRQLSTIDFSTRLCVLW